MKPRFIERDALASIARYVPPGPVMDELAAVVMNVDARFGEVMYGFAAVAVADARRRRHRTAATLLQFAAVQLADDLADGDCCYLPQPVRRGPGAQWLLQYLALRVARDAGVSAEVLSNSAAHFVRMGIAQQLEVRTTCWDLDTSALAASELNGEQYAAYLCWLWDGTDWEPAAAAVGRDFGFALHVVTDRRSGDRRFTDLDPAAREELIRRATAGYTRLCAKLPPPLSARLAWLGEALQPAAGSSAAGPSEVTRALGPLP